eukprot:jgi/Chlat1/3291/Chrsp22S03449
MVPSVNPRLSPEWENAELQLQDLDLPGAPPPDPLEVAELAAQVIQLQVVPPHLAHNLATAFARAMAAVRALRLAEAHIS